MRGDLKDRESAAHSDGHRDRNIICPRPLSQTVNGLLPEVPTGVVGSPACLAPAVLQAADMLGMYRAELARVLHLQCPHVGRLSEVREHLVPGTEAWHQAALFIRIYQALHGVMNGDEVAMCHWLRAHNKDLPGVPLLLLVDDDRLSEVLRHLEHAGRPRD